MNIALITPWMVRCGIYSYCRSLSEALAQVGVNVYIVRLPRFGTKNAEILQNVVDSIPVDKVDLIHVSHEYGLYQNLEGGFYAGLKALQKPLVTTMHAIGNWDLDNIICTTSNRMIVHNEFCARRLRHPCFIIPHGCKPEKCVSREEAKKALGIDLRIPIVGYLGFISAYKGLENLVEAMVKVPKAALLIAGGWHVDAETEYIQVLKQRSLELLPRRCQWLGYVEDDRLPTVYGAMDIVVYPSRFMTESGALLMALSHGKCVVASNVGPAKEKEKVGALTTFRDLSNLRRKIRVLLKDESQRNALEVKAWEYAESVSWNEIARRHLSFYEDILSKEAKG